LPSARPDTAVLRGQDLRLLFVVVAVAAFRFRFTTEGSLDPSWELALGWLHQRGFSHGTEIIFTFGPLGPVSNPTLAASRAWIAVSLLAHVVATAWFASVLLRALRPTRLTAGAAAVAVAAGLVAGFALPLTELVAVTVTLDVWTRLPGRALRPPSPAVVAGYGALAAAALLGKLNTGVIVAVAVGVLVLAWPGWGQRVSAAAVAGSSAAATGVVLWMATGNELAGIGPWLRAALETTTSYASAMAKNPPAVPWAALQLVLLGALVALLAAALWARCRDTDGASRWPEVALVASLTWFTLKAGLVRFDRSHVDLPLAALAILAVVLGTASRWRWMPAAAIGLATVGLVAGYDSIVAGDAQRLVDRRLEQPTQVWDAVQATASGGAYREQTAQEQAEIRDVYRRLGLTQPVVEALEGRRVHAEQWDVAALWAHGLDWRPLPVFHTYAAFSSWLDERNVDALEAADEGPDAVLRNAASIDNRVGMWDSPSARLVMACEFEAVAQDGSWSALHRAENLCGAPREIGRIHATEGEEIAVPTARPDELVVAAFELDPSLGKRAIDLVARDPHLPFVHVDGMRARFVPDAAPGLHVMAQPDRVGDRDLPGGSLAIDTVRFQNLGGPVDITFYAVPLG